MFTDWLSAFKPFIYETQPPMKKIVEYDALLGKCTSNQNWTYFVHDLKIINTIVKYTISIFKKIVWETQNWR